MQDVQEVARRLQALARYVQDRTQRFELGAARIVAEIRIGELLGPGKPGPPTGRESTPASVDSVPREDRVKFRLLAAHKAEVLRIVREMRVTSRRKILAALALRPGLPDAEWEAVGKTLRTIEGAVQWWLGDWLNYGEREYGEKYSQALDETDYSYQGVRDIAWVARSVEMSRRRDNLSFAHHRELAHLPPADQTRWLALAEREKWTRQDLRAALP